MNGDCTVERVAVSKLFIHIVSGDAIRRPNGVLARVGGHRQPRLREYLR